MWAQPVCSKEAWAQNYHIPLYSPIPPFSSNNLTLLLTAIVLTPYFQYIFCILYFGASLRTEYVSPVTQAQEKDCYLGPAACWLVSDNWSSAVTTDHALARWLVRWGEVRWHPLRVRSKPGQGSLHSFLVRTISWKTASLWHYSLIFFSPSSWSCHNITFDWDHWQTPDPRVDDSDTVCLWRHNLGMLRCASDWSEWR